MHLISVRRENCCMSISVMRLVAPITLVGFTALSVDISTSRFTPCSEADISRLRVPNTLFFMASAGEVSMAGTCLWAAAWNTMSGEYIPNTSSSRFLSRIEPISSETGQSRPYLFSSSCSSS